jgi:hypothetical protein
MFWGQIYGPKGFRRDWNNLAEKNFRRKFFGIEDFSAKNLLCFSGFDQLYQAGSFIAGIGKGCAIFARIKSRAGRGGHRGGGFDEDAGADFGGFSLPTAGEGDLGGFGRTISAEELLASAGIINEKGGALFGGTQQWVDHGDQTACCADVGGDGFFPILDIEMRGWGQRGGVNGSVDPKVQTAPAIVNRAAQVAHGIVVGDVHWGEGEGTHAGKFQGLNAVVEFFERTNGTGDGDDMPAFAGKFQGHGRAKAARGTCDKGDALEHGLDLWVG